MTDKPHRLIWIDTETTSISPRDGQLLEVAMHLTDTRGMERIESGAEAVAWRWIIRHDAIRLTPATAYAIELHTRNGLIDDVFGPESETPDSVAACILDTLTDLADRYVLHPAGTNVQFDLDWIHAALGLTLEQLDYHHLDMSGLRILARQTIPNWPKHPAGTHRALDCLTRDIAEYRTIIDTIKEHQ